jgi:hypothetical protein
LDVLNLISRRRLARSVSGAQSKLFQPNKTAFYFGAPLLLRTSLWHKEGFLFTY